MANYTFEEINDLCKQPKAIESLLEQRDTFRVELMDQAERIKTLEKKVSTLETITNELNITE